MRVSIKNKEKVTKFSTIFKNINDILSNVKLCFTEEKLTAQGMDMTQCCLFEINILAEWFDEYNIDDNITIGLPCNLMYKLLSCLEENQEIVMYMDKKLDKLYIDFENDKKYRKFICNEIELYLRSKNYENKNIIWFVKEYIKNKFIDLEGKILFEKYLIHHTLQEYHHNDR